MMQVDTMTMKRRMEKIKDLYSNLLNYNWDDVNGKTLEIDVSYNEGMKIVTGYDKDEGKIYILHSEQYFH